MNTSSNHPHTPYLFAIFISLPIKPVRHVPSDQTTLHQPAISRTRSFMNMLRLCSRKNNQVAEDTRNDWLNESVITVPDLRPNTPTSSLVPRPRNYPIRLPDHPAPPLPKFRQSSLPSSTIPRRWKSLSKRGTYSSKTEPVFRASTHHKMKKWRPDSSSVRQLWRAGVTIRYLYSICLSLSVLSRVFPLLFVFSFIHRAFFIAPRPYDLYSSCQYYNPKPISSVPDLLNP